MTKIIGFAGTARAGKDTAANFLVETLQDEMSNCVWLNTGEVFISGFAAVIKEHVKAIFGWDYRHIEGELKAVRDPKTGVIPREAMQTLGQAMRDLNPDVWVQSVERFLNSQKQRPAYLILKDIRHPNEAEWIQENHGTVVYVDRGGETDLTEEQKQHESERHMDEVSKLADIVIDNHGTLEELRASINEEFGAIVL